MKFPRNAKVFYGQLDFAPLAGVFFLLTLFILISSLIYTPGVRINLPAGGNLPGLDKPTITLAVDAEGRFYFDNQLMPLPQCKSRIASALRKAEEPLVLLIQADKNVRYETLIELSLVARDAGVQEVLLATLPEATAPVAPAVFPVRP